jgi:hypothetical protein
MELSERETVALYLFLGKREEELDESLFSLYTRIQKSLNERLSIEEMETLDRLYAEKVDIFNGRG